jgi:hypothetical protein
LRNFSGTVYYVEEWPTYYLQGRWCSLVFT